MEDFSASRTEGAEQPVIRIAIERGKVNKRLFMKISLRSDFAAEESKSWD
jgi:hypothetical protein